MNVKMVKTNKEREDAFQVRMTVFVEEQNVPQEEELDSFDKTAIHFVGYDQEQPVAASRLRFEDEYGKLERICVLKSSRGKHFGKMLMNEMENEIISNGYKKAKLHSQTHAENFYTRFGYETVSEIFMDAGIPHVTMIKTL